MSLARLLRRSDSLSDSARRLLGTNSPAHDSVDLEAIVKQLEQDVSLTLRLIQDNSIEAKAKVAESVALAERIQTASHHLASLSGKARSNAECLVDTARHLEQSSRQIKEQADTSDAFLGEARLLTDEVGLQMSNLRDAASTIASVTGIIRQVARQTNLLALNATIEAARAGPASQGFTVVANEVKSLANDVHRATSSIAGRIHDLEKAMSSATTSVGRMVDLFGRIDPLIEAINASAVNQIEATLDVAAKAVETANFADSVADGAQSMQALAAEVARTSQLAGSETEHMAATVDRLSNRSMFYFRKSLLHDRRQQKRVPILLPASVITAESNENSYVLECSPGFMTIPADTRLFEGNKVEIYSRQFGTVRGEVDARTETTFSVRLSELSKHQLQRIEQLNHAVHIETQAQAQSVINVAQQISDIFNKAVSDGRISRDALLSNIYTKVPQTTPIQYLHESTDFYDQNIQEVINRNRQLLPQMVFLVLIDKNSYVPVHFPEYSKPQRPGDTRWNDLNCRNRRIMTRSQTSIAARNEEKFAVSLYVRDMSDHQKAYCRLFASPIRIGDALWGNLTCAVQMTAHPLLVD